MLRKLLLILIGCAGLLGGCTTTGPEPQDPHSWEDITGNDDVDWWW